MESEVALLKPIQLLHVIFSEFQLQHQICDVGFLILEAIPEFPRDGVEPPRVEGERGQHGLHEASWRVAVIPTKTNEKEWKRRRGKEKKDMEVEVEEEEEKGRRDEEGKGGREGGTWRGGRRHHVR